MKIHPMGTPQVTSPRDVQRQSRHEAAGRRQQEDQVAFSQGARDVARGREALAHLPPVRADRVEALRAAIARGEYRVDSRALAERLLDVLDE